MTRTLRRRHEPFDRERDLAWIQGALRARGLERMQIKRAHRDGLALEERIEQRFNGEIMRRRARARSAMWRWVIGGALVGLAAGLALWFCLGPL